MQPIVDFQLKFQCRRSERVWGCLNYAVWHVHDAIILQPHRWKYLVHCLCVCCIFNDFTTKSEYDFEIGCISSIWYGEFYGAFVTRINFVVHKFNIWAALLICLAPFTSLCIFSIIDWWKCRMQRSVWIPLDSYCDQNNDTVPRSSTKNFVNIYHVTNQLFNQKSYLELIINVLHTMNGEHSIHSQNCLHGN